MSLSPLIKSQKNILIALTMTWSIVACLGPTDNSNKPQNLSPRQTKVTPGNYLSGKSFCRKYNEITGTEFGRFITVPKNYSSPNSQKFEIYAYTKAAFDQNKPTLIYLDGGPGGNSHGRRNFADGRFNEIFMDQRGLGCSAPNTYSEYLDSSIYSSRNTIFDMEQVRKAYGVDKWSVYGISYGTVPATMYAHEFPNQTRSLILEGVISSSVDDRNEFIAEKLNLIIFEMTENQRTEIRKLFYNDSNKFSQLIDAITALFYFNRPALNAKQILNEIFPLNTSIDSQALERFLVEEQDHHSELYLPQAPGTVDSNILNIINCKDLNLIHELVKTVWFNGDKFYVYTFDNSNLNKERCLNYGIEQVNETPYLIENNQVIIPTYYWQGAQDGATTARGAIEHWRKVPKDISYYLMAQRGGHSPNALFLSKYVQEHKPTVYHAQLELFSKSILAQTIAFSELVQINESLAPLMKWTLYKKESSQKPEDDLGDIQALIGGLNFNFAK